VVVGTALEVKATVVVGAGVAVGTTVVVGTGVVVGATVVVVIAVVVVAALGAVVSPQAANRLRDAITHRVRLIFFKKLLLCFNLNIL
jgi:hypothetical protein